MHEQFNRNEARKRWNVLISSLKPIEHGFNPEKHAPIFTTGEPDVSAVRAYLNSIRVDLRDPKALPNTADELLKLCWRAFDTTEFKKQSKTKRKQTEIVRNADNMVVAISLAKEFHGKPLADLWKKYDELRQEIGDANTRAENHDSLKVYTWLVTTVFNNTMINHFEAVTGKKFDRRALETREEGYTGDGLDTGKTHAERTITFLKYLHGWTRKREDEKSSTATRQASMLEKAEKIPGFYVLSEKEKGKLNQLAIQLIAKNNPRALELLDEEAFRMHANKFDRLAAKEPYAQLQLPKRLRLLKTDPQRRAILFAAVHHMDEGIPPNAVNALFPSLPTKSSTVAAEETPEQKPKTRFPLVEDLPISDDEKATANRLLRAQRDRLEEKIFDNFLQKLETRIKAGEGVLDAIRNMHAEFHPKEMKVSKTVAEQPRPETMPAKQELDTLSVSRLLKMIDESISADPAIIYALKKKIPQADDEQRIRIAEHVILDFLAGMGRPKNLHWNRFKVHFQKPLQPYLNQARDRLRDNGHIEEDESGGNKWKVSNRLRVKYSRKT
ncbi:MAG: hypothetical protein V1811_01535 [Candidatus Micrarchaeota archaeon]